MPRIFLGSEDVNSSGETNINPCFHGAYILVRRRKTSIK
jgi:hypothetical protein